MKITKTRPTTTTALAADRGKTAADALREQYKIVIQAEAATFKERVRFGAMLIQWEQFLGGGAGRGHDGDGLKGWLAENCPEIEYYNAMRYKSIAAKAIKMIGGGQMATAALLGDGTVAQPCGETVDVESEYVERAEDLFEKADSRRKLEQLWFAFSRDARRGEPKERAKLPKLAPQEEAKSIWTGVMNVLDRAAVLDAIPLLPGKIAEVCFERVTALRDALKARLREDD